MKRYPVSGGTEDTCQKTKYYYDVNPYDGSFSLNGWGRMVVSEYSICSPAGLRTVREMYSYTTPGLVGKKRFRVDKLKEDSPGQGTAGSAQLDTAWTYDNEGKTVTTTYPSQAGLFTGSTFTYGSTRWGVRRG